MTKKIFIVLGVLEFTANCIYFSIKTNLWIIDWRIKRHSIAAPQNMDNYSFSVGVWCATRILNPEGWRTNDHGRVLHDARHLSQTNGWPSFNNRIGFRGDE